MSEDTTEIDFRNALHGIHGAKDYKELEAKKDYVSNFLRKRYPDPIFDEVFEVLNTALENGKDRIERAKRILKLCSDVRILGENIKDKCKNIK